ncbi:MAG: tRNA (guanosine(37)-N1)-methyltransferase TrmD [Tissierellaceae bacterium]|jgi:tRNA (guanine37-N1)-methyltransferase|nr:tRNA (guanosine(37)-N1)-methyltransferase TrmD [Tissierellia bacterium]
MKIDVLTLFPEFLSNLSTWSIIGRAVDAKILTLDYINIRDYSRNKHKKVDDYSYGGGPGMVMTPQPIVDAINSVKEDNSWIIYLSPQGKRLDQNIVNRLSKKEHLILVCGHYEGIDNRVVEHYIDEEISIGDYVLTGGEIPAMVLIDSVSRLLPGVLTSEESFSEESHYKGLLEYPQYTRPYDYEGYKVPDLLLSGNHKEIEKWRHYQALKTTFLKRPDILENLELSKEDMEILETIKKELNK